MTRRADRELVLRGVGRRIGLTQLGVGLVEDEGVAVGVVHVIHGGVVRLGEVDVRIVMRRPGDILGEEPQPDAQDAVEREVALSQNMNSMGMRLDPMADVVGSRW